MEIQTPWTNSNTIKPKDTNNFNREWFSGEIYVDKSEKKGFTILRITVHGKHPKKKMIDDTTRTYYVESWTGEFIIDGEKKDALAGTLFIIEPGHEYEYSGNMILMETNISKSNTFKDELIETLQKDI